MSIGATIFMAASWGFVLALNIFCLVRLLKNPK